MTAHRGIPHRAAGMPPVRPGDVLHMGTLFGPRREDIIGLRWWRHAAEEGGFWMIECIGVTRTAPKASWGDRIIPAPRPHPTGGWGHRHRVRP